MVFEDARTFQLLLVIGLAALLLGNNAIQTVPASVQGIPEFREWFDERTVFESNLIWASVVMLVLIAALELAVRKKR